MKRMSVRDIRQRWPEAERVLREGGEIAVTRDGKPVARILPFGPTGPRLGPRVDWEALENWRKRFWKRQPPQPPTEIDVERGRTDRE